MKIHRITIILLCTFAITSCGGNNNNSDQQNLAIPGPVEDIGNKTENIYVGTWLGNCISGQIAKLVLTEISFSRTIYKYTENNCTGNLQDEQKFDANIIYEDVVTTTSGVTARNITIHIDAPSPNLYIEPNLLYRNGNQLYIGDTPIRYQRPSDVNFNFPYTLQKP